MPTIDDKVVAMSFENSKFESGVRTTMASLDKLKKSLQFDGASKGLTNLGSSIGGLNSNFRPLNKSIDSVRAHFSILNVAAGAIIGHIAIQLTNLAERIAKAFTIGPILQGLDIYQTKLQAIQTILANTQAAGTKMKDVNAALNQLNIYANKTIYSFGQMTKNIGTFTAAGVGLKPAVAAIKGIANLAALSGSNADQASTAMYQLSQAISAGRVSLQDWNSVVNAGMGGTVFQRALTTTAVAMGKISEKSVKLVGPMKNVKIAGESFRQSIQAGPGKTSWLTGDVLTKTLATFTGDMTKAQLAATGFNAQQIKDIQATAKTALNAATQVKTFSQLMDITKETIATGWAQSFEILIGKLGEAKKLFTSISNAFNDVINKSAAARNKILGDWKALGGRTLLIKALGEVFGALGDVLRPIKDAFRDIFPRKTGRDLFDLTVRFKKFADTLKPTQTTVDNLRRTFRGIFAIIDIGKQIIGGIIGVFAKLFHVIFSGSGSFLQVTGNIGDFLVSVDLALKKGKGLQTFFTGLGHVLAVPLHLFGQIAHAVTNMFGGFSPGDFSVKMDVSTKAAEPFKKVLEVITSSLQALGPAISNAVQNMNFDLILSIIRTGLLAGLVLMIRKFIGGTTLERTLGIFGKQLGFGFAKNLGGGILGNLSKSFGSLTGSLKAMQQNLQAKTLETLAIAIALLAASVVALSFVKPKRLNAALTAMAIGFGELIGVMVLMNKLTDVRATVKLPVIAASLVLMATAIDLLAIAVFTLAKLNTGELAKGLGAIAILLGTVAGAMKLMPKGLIFTSTSMVILATALNVMALAVRQFGSMNLITLGKGLLGIGGALVAIAIGMKLMPKGLIFTSTSILILSVALNALALAVRQFGDMSIVALGKGLLGIGGALVAIAIGMKLMPKGLIFTSTSMVILAVALNGFALALKQMGGMSIGEIAKSLITLAASLTILAIAMRQMVVSLFGAAALVLISASIGILALSLTAFSKLSIGSIIKSLIVLAATFVIIGTAASLAAESIPALIGFGAALILIGAGLALAGAGVALIGVGLSAIVVAGPAAIAILIEALINLSKSIGEIGKNTVLGLLEIVKAFAKVAPQFVKAAAKIIDTIAEALIKSGPKVAEALIVILVAGLEALDKHANEIIAAGFGILEKLLQGISDNIGLIVTMAVTIIVNFIDSLTKNFGRLINAGFHFITSILTGIANNIDNVIRAGAHIITKFVEGLGQNAADIVKAAGKAVATFLGAVGNVIVGIAKAAGKVIVKLGDALVIAARSSKKFFNSAGKALLIFLTGIDAAVSKYTAKIVEIGIKIGAHLSEGVAQGMVKGLGDVGLSVADSIIPGLHFARKKVQHAIKSHSPSKVWMEIGKSISDGLTFGIKDNLPNATKSIEDFSNNLQHISNMAIEHLDITPTITPILDLSAVQDGASKLTGIINKNPLGTVSLSHASVISARQAAVNADGTIPTDGGPSIKFQQNNFSPRALTAIEVYRQTRNQLAQLKSKAILI